MCVRLLMQLPASRNPDQLGPLQGRLDHEGEALEQGRGRQAAGCRRLHGRDGGSLMDAAAYTAETEGH